MQSWHGTLRSNSESEEADEPAPTTVAMHTPTAIHSGRPATPAIRRRPMPGLGALRLTSHSPNAIALTAVISHINTGKRRK